MAEILSVQTTVEHNIAWITIDNPPVNATSLSVRKGLVDALQTAQSAQIAVLSCAGRTFVAGGDITEFDAPPAEPHLPDVVQIIEDSPVPVIAAMHGTVFGGGFELAMGCAWRIAAKGTRFALPEVNIGIIPGAGGSQRLPRLIGLDRAIDVACSGVVLDAAELFDLGGLDRVVDGDLRQAVEEFIINLPPRPTALRHRVITPLSDDLLASKKMTITKNAKGQRSPLENFEAMRWATQPFSTGQPKERSRHLQLRHTAESRALRHAFFAERQGAKPAAIAGIKGRDISHIAVVGGGLMGAGIAGSALLAGLKVTMIERDGASADAGRNRVSTILEGRLKRGKISENQFQDHLANFDASDNYDAAAQADLAVEAVFEDLDVKCDVFHHLSRVMGPNAILATNTSYLDPTQIFEGIENPSRCLGLHFFSPAHIMKLLEIVQMPQTSANVLATGFALGKKMKKVSVLSGICDGFIGNRMLAAYRRGADYLLADGALPYQIDAAMREFGMPMGPYELQDLTGLQISWANRKRLAATRDANERYITFGDQLCEMGRFGQRSGKGWYLYQDGNRSPKRDETVEEMISDSWDAPTAFLSKEISSRLMAVLANEGALILAEGIAENSAAIDTVQIAGYGFPRWRGGPMQYATEIGWDVTAETMKMVAQESPKSWRLAKMEPAK